MKTLESMSTGHMIIEAFILIACVWLLYLLFKSFTDLFRFFRNDRLTESEISSCRLNQDKTEMSARVRYEQTEKLMNQIKSNSIK